jgi:hypothetical protein
MTQPIQGQFSILFTGYAPAVSACQFAEQETPVGGVCGYLVESLAAGERLAQHPLYLEGNRVSEQLPHRKVLQAELDAHFSVEFT